MRRVYGVVDLDTESSWHPHHDFSGICRWAGWQCNGRGRANEVV